MNWKQIVPIILLLPIPGISQVSANSKYPLHGKVTSVGKRNVVYQTVKTATITTDDGTKFTIEQGRGYIPSMGDEVDFRIDAKHQHAWIPLPNKKGAEDKYDIDEEGK